MQHITVCIFFTICVLRAHSFECVTCNANVGDNDADDCFETVEKCEEGVESCSMVTYVSKSDNKLHIRKFCTSPGTPIYQYLLFFPGSALCQNIETGRDLEFPKNINKDLLSEEIFPPSAVPEDLEHVLPLVENESNVPEEVELQSENTTFPEPPTKLLRDEKRKLFGPPSIRPDETALLTRAKRVRREAGPPAPPTEQRSSLLCVCSTERCNSGSAETVLSRSMFSNLPFTMNTVRLPIDDATLQNVARR
ncbi:unnamed protein product [Bursaphelenchus okinawaensis]|uniref:UPAR/Ly6 domain-containing protein n=1 Tax=Bursaphelenchus okinawaensis TaxID=465554 RepID=A0A811LEB4_9BILA|nr:unnamed protein product [Bursaphelenchus okinawaensis]CAG9122263.1 unnamed protein product [Bursaphelenchus okinawaensis]